MRKYILLDGVPVEHETTNSSVVVKIDNEHMIKTNLETPNGDEIWHINGKLYIYIGEDLKSYDGPTVDPFDSDKID